jgi:hypothetical protein
MHEGFDPDKYVFTWEFIFCAYKLPKKTAWSRTQDAASLNNRQDGMVNAAFSHGFFSLVF